MMTLHNDDVDDAYNVDDDDDDGNGDDGNCYADIDDIDDDDDNDNGGDGNGYDDIADDDDDNVGENLYSSMITASCSSTVSRLCGNKPFNFTTYISQINQINFLGSFLKVQKKLWPVLRKHL